MIVQQTEVWAIGFLTYRNMVKGVCCSIVIPKDWKLPKSVPKGFKLCVHLDDGVCYRHEMSEVVVYVLR